MTRTLERLDGLALLGGASVGRLRFPTPGLLESRRSGEAGPGPYLRSAPAPAGTRRLLLGDGENELDLAFPILAPEIGGAGTGIHPAGSGTLHLHAPLDPEALAAARAQRPELLALGNARTLYADGRAFVAALSAIREGFGAGPVLWAPRVALPHRVALLFYLGIDLIDTTEGRRAAVDGTYLDPVLGPLPASAARSRERCPCDGCRDPASLDLDAHARHAYRSAVAEARFAAASGRLRELVESRTVAEPAMAELLRYADRDLASLLDERTPVTGGESRNYVLLESHRRPEMARFRRRLLERYRPPAAKTVLLLVPCSRTKPYRASRSHRRFRTAFEELRHVERLHVVSVSSPIGLVPQELEDVPPARHYDIPVTGEWQESERRYVLEALGHLLAQGSYRTVVVHLDPEEYDFLQPLLSDPERHVWTLRGDRTTSPEAIASLRAAVTRALERETPVPGGPLAVVRQELAEVAAVQFGRGVAERLFAPPARLAGRPWFQRLTDGTADLATLREERGLFQLTVRGARRLWPDLPLSVEIDAGVSLEGDLFVPGVRSADPAIRAGDAVVLVRSGELAGVGEAALPGRLMTELGRGLAVSVRHRVHASTDTAMTEDGPPPTLGPVV